VIVKTVKINESKCNACCKCVTACQEGAIGIIGGKAKLLNGDNCHEFGRCLSICPTKAITYEEVEETIKDAAASRDNAENRKNTYARQRVVHEPEQKQTTQRVSQLYQWPVHIRLIATNVAYFANADLLVAAECSAYVYANFHNDYMKDRITIIGCPKLDDLNYTEKLVDIFKVNKIKSVVVARMDVSCCNGIENAVKKALHIVGIHNIISSRIVTISTNGRVLEMEK